MMIGVRIAPEPSSIALPTWMAWVLNPRVSGWALSGRVVMGYAPSGASSARTVFAASTRFFKAASVSA